VPSAQIHYGGGRQRNSKGGAEGEFCGVKNFENGLSPEHWRTKKSREPQSTKQHSNAFQRGKIKRGIQQKRVHLRPRSTRIIPYKKGVREKKRWLGGEVLGKGSKSVRNLGISRRRMRVISTPLDATKLNGKRRTLP